jgi:hypothetical protein
MRSPCSVSVCVYPPPLLLGNCSINSCNEYARNNRTVERVVSYAVRVVSKESRLLVLLRTFCNNSGWIMLFWFVWSFKYFIRNFGDRRLETNNY